METYDEIKRSIVLKATEEYVTIVLKSVGGNRNRAASILDITKGELSGICMTLGIRVKRGIVTEARGITFLPLKDYLEIPLAVLERVYFVAVLGSARTVDAAANLAGMTVSDFLEKVEELGLEPVELFLEKDNPMSFVCKVETFNDRQPPQGKIRPLYV